MGSGCPWVPGALVVLVYGGCHHREPQTGLARSSGGWKTKIKAPAGLVSAPWSAEAVPCLCLDAAEREPSGFVVFIEGHQSHHGAPPSRAHVTLITSRRSPLLIAVVGGWASTCAFWGTRVVSSPSSSCYPYGTERGHEPSQAGLSTKAPLPEAPARHGGQKERLCFRSDAISF